MAQTIDIISIKDEVPVYESGDFGFLLPAFNEDQFEEALRILPYLINVNCSQIACVGLMAERLHDEIDLRIGDVRKQNILTTFMQDILVACEYFIFAAGSSVNHLVALVANHHEVIQTLKDVIKEYQADS